MNRLIISTLGVLIIAGGMWVRFHMLSTQNERLKHERRAALHALEQTMKSRRVLEQELVSARLRQEKLHEIIVEIEAAEVSDDGPVAPVLDRALKRLRGARRYKGAKPTR